MWQTKTEAHYSYCVICEARVPKGHEVCGDDCAKVKKELDEAHARVVADEAKALVLD